MSSFVSQNLIGDWKPHPYQLRALLFVLRRRHSALFLDPGLGKTSVMLALLSALKRLGLMRGALVIAPLRVMQSVWPAEAQRWRQFQGLRFAVLHGAKKHKALFADADVWLTTPDTVRWLATELPASRVPFDVLVIDESTKFKASDTQRFRNLKKLIPLFRRRHILTGTPVPNGLHELWAQCYAVDQGKALGRTVTEYRNRYFRQNLYTHTWALARPSYAERITRRVAHLAIRMRAQDYLDLPDVLYQDIRVSLPSAARQAYDDIERYFFASLDDGADIHAGSAAVALSKCQQLANGTVYDEDDAPKTMHREKVKALRDLLDQSHRLLVVYKYRHDLDAIRKEFGDVAHLGGGVTATQTAETIRQWNNGAIELLPIHCATGHGLNLQHAENAHICWYSLTYSLEQYQQTNARIHRQGRAGRVIVHHIVATDTVDEAILKTLQAKDDSQQNFLEAIDNYRRQREW